MGIYTDTRKIDLIEKLLRTKDEDLLLKIESLLKSKPTQKLPVNTKKSIRDFVGIITKQESEDMKTIIKATCEEIDEESWR